jgi:hypothetical protein
MDFLDINGIAVKKEASVLNDCGAVKGGVPKVVEHCDLRGIQA